MILYVSGPSHNTVNAEAAVARLRELGHTVISPHEFLATDMGVQWGDPLRTRLAAMLNCQGIYLLNNWTKFPECKIEWRLAHELNYTVFYQPLDDTRHEPESVPH